MITVHLPSQLRGAMGRGQLELPGGTVGEVLLNLEGRLPPLRGVVLDDRQQLRRYLALFLNHEEVRLLSTPVVSGDQLVLLQAIAGG